MAIITNNPLLRGARGMFAGTLIFRQVKGQTVMQARPTPTTLESKVQKENRSQFAQASAYAKAAMLDSQLKDQYREEAKRLKLPNPYTAALTIKLRDLKALRDEQEANATLNQVATPQMPARVHPPEPFKSMNLKEYMLNSTTTGKRFRGKHKATLSRPAIRPLADMIDRLLDKTKDSPVGQLCLPNSHDEQFSSRRGLLKITELL